MSLDLLLHDIGLVGTSTNQIVRVNKRILDPRRPKHALSADDKEEMLIPYSSALPEDKKAVLTYYLQVKRFTSKRMLLLQNGGVTFLTIFSLLPHMFRSKE